MSASRFTLLLAAFLGLAVTARAENANGVKAIVNDSVITQAEVEEYARPAAEAMLRQHRAQPAVFQQKLATMMEKALEELIEHQLILWDFRTAGYNFPEALLDESVEERVRLQFGDDRSRLMKSLQAMGKSYEKFRADKRNEVIIEALTSKNVSQEIIISPHKIESFYLAHQDKYKLDDQVKLRMIVLNKDGATPARALAGEIIGKLKEGAAFSEMASVYSQGAQKREGGSWGWVEKTVLRKELADVAFKLKTGEFSDIIETPEEIGRASCRERVYSSV